MSNIAKNKNRFDFRRSGFLLQVLQFLEALGADVLSLEYRDILGAVTENAAGLILFQNDGRALHIDFQCILFRDVQCAAHFDRENDSTQFIDFSHDSSCFHNISPFLF